MDKRNLKLILATLILLAGVGAGAQLAKHFWDVVIDNDLTVGGVTPSAAQWGHVSTMDQDVATTSDVEHNLLQFPEIATPTTPATNKNRIYFKSDGNAYRLDDAGIEKKLGSGGGGSAGVDLLAELNGSCEDGDPPIEWVNVGAAFSAETVNPGFDAQSCAWDPSAASQTLTTATVTIPDGLQGQNCAAEFWTKWSGTAGDVKVKVEDGSDVIIRGPEDVVSSSDWVKSSLSFICPTSGDMRLEFVSTADSSELLVDNVKLGDNVLVEVSQASLVGTAQWEAAASCDRSVTSTSFADMPVDTDCPDPTITGSTISAPSTKFLGLDVNWGPGNYVISFNAPYFTNTTITSWSCRFEAGGTVSTEWHNRVRTAADEGYETGTHMYSLSLPNGYVGEVRLQCLAASGAVRIPATITGMNTNMFVHKFPLQSQQAYTADTLAQYWEGVITDASGTTQIGIGAGTGIDQPNDWEVINLNGNAMVACDDGEAPSGTTCSGNASLGVAITPKVSGKHEVCMTAVTYATGNNVGRGTIDEYYIWRVDPTTGATITEHPDTDRWRWYSTANSHHGGNSFDVCATEYLNAGTTAAFRLIRTSFNINVGPLSHFLTSRQVASPIDGAIYSYFRIRNLDQSLPAPLIKNSVVSSSEGVERIERVKFGGATEYTNNCTSSPCTIHSQSGGIASVTRVSAGVYNINFNSDTFSGNMVCNINCALLGTGACIGIPTTGATPTTSTIFEVITTNVAGAVADAEVNATCHGPR